MTDLAAARKNIDLAYGRLKPLRDSLPESVARDDLTFALKRLIDAKNALAPPAPPPPAPRIRGAMVVTAGNIDPRLLKGAGVSHVAVELTGANLSELAAWNGYGFTKGGLFISRGPDAVNEAVHVSTILRDNPWLSFVVIDTECHKVGMGGERVWTENLYRELRARAPLPFPILNITFGVDAHVDDAVNHTALRAHSIGAIWEAYDGSGATLGVKTIRDKAIAGGWVPPHIALGDKSLVADCIELVATPGVGDVWLWAPDNGPAQDALRSGVVIP